MLFSLSWIVWLDSVFEVKYPCFPTTIDIVKDPSCWSHDCLVSIRMSPIHYDIVHRLPIVTSPWVFTVMSWGSDTEY